MYNTNNQNVSENWPEDAPVTLMSGLGIANEGISAIEVADMNRPRCITPHSSTVDRNG